MRSFSAMVHCPRQEKSDKDSNTSVYPILTMNVIQQHHDNNLKREKLKVHMIMQQHNMQQQQKFTNKNDGLKENCNFNTVYKVRSSKGSA